jgi:hypothetical protein
LGLIRASICTANCAWVCAHGYSCGVLLCLPGGPPMPRDPLLFLPWRVGPFIARDCLRNLTLVCCVSCWQPWAPLLGTWSWHRTCIAASLARAHLQQFCIIDHTHPRRRTETTDSCMHLSLPPSLVTGAVIAVAGLPPARFRLGVSI